MFTQFTLIHGPNILASQAILFFTTSDFTFTTNSPSDTSTGEHGFCFGPASSFFLELFLCSSLVAYWTLWLGRVIFWCHIFFPFYTVYGFLRWEYSSGLLFPSRVDHILSELSTITCPFWVALQSMAHNFIKLHKAMIHVMILVSFLWLWFSFWRLWDCSSCFFCLSSNGWE